MREPFGQQTRPSISERVIDSLDERLGVRSIWAALMDRHIPRSVNWWYTLGSATLFVFTLQVVTGIFLAAYYVPSPDHAYDSVQYIMNEVIFGQVVRGLHHWGASAMVVLVVAHMLRVIVMGAYKYPREFTWTAGVFLLLLTFGFGFTGYLLPWDEKAYWATTVGTNMAGTVPVVGGFILRVLRGGADLGAVTLARFFAFHVLLLPALIVPLVGLHLFMVVRIGISGAPDRAYEREQQARQRGYSGISGLPKRSGIPKR
ncbi:MAG: cytochrome b N-terminal domain-containing protein [Bacteroidetes bacterium]|nr:cytochrome b N-terminal domain-containing protein [Bacteroidota bacterium]MCL5026514.1 cytochrome b N-terminal domain-containing protein [Chloroflexota bacterium]